MYFTKRLAGLVPLLLLITLLAFLLVRVAPGGPFDRERAPASPEIDRALQAKYRLDEPVWKQYGRWIGGVAQGDFGPSFKYRNHTVTEIIAQGLPISMTLGALAFCFAIGLGVPMGVWMALRRGSMTDFGLGFAALLAVCVPGFVVAPLLVISFAIHWRWFPVALWGSPWHAVLPTLALGLFFAGKVSRLARESMTTVLQQEFILTARAKGVSETILLWRHALKPSLLPVVSFSGPMLADLLTGSFVIENLFQLPGIGVFLVNSSLNRDYPMVVGLVVVYATLLLLLNLLVDVSYRWLDPRVKHE